MTPSSRRRFLQRIASLGLAGAFARTTGVSFAQMAGGSGFGDYKALVCLFLYGGNDSWNTVVPYSAAEWGAYARSRGAGNPWGLALERDALLPVSPEGQSGDAARYGFHPSMAQLRDLFEAGQLALLPNVGPLLRPTTLAQYREALETGHELPPQLYSHNDQQEQWQTLRGNRGLNSGWAGRIADILRPGLAGQALPTNISLFGQSVFQAGETESAYTMSSGGVQSLDGLLGGFAFEARRQRIEAIQQATLASGQRSYYERGYARTHQRMLKYAELVEQTLAQAPVLSALPDSIPGSASLLTQMRTVAKMIAMRESLGMSRQIFLVAAGGFDQHDNQMAEQPGLLAEVSQSVRAFHDSMQELGVSEQVTLFTQSDFGRTLTSNGDGSDHGWGGLQMVVGGAVRGRRMYGEYPLLELGGPLEVGGGIFIPTTATDQYAATLARWFGVDESNLDTVAPYLDRFATRDLGFMV